jgi:hypothetical protein
MIRKLAFSILAACASLLCAQQAAKPPDSNEAAGQPATPKYDPGKVAAQIRASFYHPDDLSSLDCSLSVDWPGFLSQVTAGVSEARMKALRGLKIKTHAVRGQTTDVKFDWTTGVPDGDQQLTNGFRQVLDSFYQLYWSMLASPVFSGEADVEELEPLPDGGANVYSHGDGISAATTVDKNFLPTFYKVESPTMNATMEPSYLPSPRPIPGDLRRVSSMRVTEQEGDSIVKVETNLDYQDVDKFHVPWHVKDSEVGTYSISMDFTECSANQSPAVSQ